MQARTKCMNRSSVKGRPSFLGRFVNECPDLYRAERKRVKREQRIYDAERTDGRGQQQQRSQKSCARDSQTWKPASLPPSLASLSQRVKAGVPSEAEEDHDEKQRRDGRRTDAPTLLLAIDTLPAASFRPSLNRPRPLLLGRTNLPQILHRDVTMHRMQAQNLKFNGQSLVWSPGRAIFCAGIRKCISRPTGATALTKRTIITPFRGSQRGREGGRTERATGNRQTQACNDEALMK